MKRILLTLSTVGFLAVAGAAQAATSVYLDDCDAFGCEGSTLFLSVADQGDGSWLATYTINTDDYSDSRIGFNQIGFKAVSGWSSATLLSAPNGTANWSSVLEAPINSNSQCSNSNGNSDKLCIYGQNSLLNVQGGGDFTWMFRIVGGTLLTDEWHLGAQYANAIGPATGKIISAEGGPAVPEPSAALLFGVGAILVTRRFRR